MASDPIYLDVHPSRVGLPNNDVVTKRPESGRVWQDRVLTRLCLPGGRWIDYDTHDEAMDARDRLLSRLDGLNPIERQAALQWFFEAE